MEELYNKLELLPDGRFERGISLLSQKDHRNGDRYTVLKKFSFYDTEARQPYWNLAQWDSGPCLVENMIDAGPGIITDGTSRLFSYDTASDTMKFRLDTSAYYQGKPAMQGDYWPHLLIEAPEFTYRRASDEEKKFYSCGADAIIVSLDIALCDYKITHNPDDWVEAAQFLLYLYVKNADTNDFCWFGLQLLDNRWDLNGHYIGYDGGKADASSAMIYSIGSKYVYESAGRSLYKGGQPDAGGDFVHVSVDIKPYLEDMFRIGKEENYFKCESLDELIINGMNMGWETIGTFDHTMEIRNLSVTSYIRK
ncbi:MAG: hypothetical protein ILO53_05535 [Clostridia bacterium]|nr:hypothetical protein [Clostridia bacterium]